MRTANRRDQRRQVSLMARPGRRASARSLLRVPNQARGLGPIQACAPGAWPAPATCQVCSDWTQTSGVPSGILTSDQELSQEQANEARKRWNESNSPGKSVAVLGKRRPRNSHAQSKEEIQFLNPRSFDVLSIGQDQLDPRI